MGIAEDKVRKYIAAIEKNNKKINAVLFLNNKAIEEARAIDEKYEKTGKCGRLYGYVIGVKSNINVLGLPASCASKTLENYKSTYDATVIEKIKSEDGVIIGMLNMDEFASGWSGETSAFGATDNPRASGYIAGGSSSGSAAAVAAGFCDMALGSDTGGSIRNPASHCGVVGVKPSYGLVSRYGLIDLSMSLDQIGPLANNVTDAALLLDVIKGIDEKDSASISSEDVSLNKPSKIKIGVIKIAGVQEGIQNLCDKAVDALVKKNSWSADEVKIEHIDLAVETYYPLVFAEFYSGTRRFDGRRYGKLIEESAGSEVLRRILGGAEITKAEFLGKYYEKALSVKEVIMKEFENAFNKFDCIVLPVCPILPWKIGAGKNMKPEQLYAADALTIPANLAGICSVSVPVGKVNEMPVGIQIMAGRGEESKMLSVALEMEEVVNGFS